MTALLQLDGVLPRDADAPDEALSLEVAEGSVCVLFTNDQGAAAVIRMCIGLAQPARGSVRVLGRDPATLDSRGLRALRHDVGVCLRPIGLMNTLTLRMNVALPLIHGDAVSLDDALERADALLERFGIGAYGSLRPAEVTGDVQQQAALARAVVRRPALVLLEAPAARLGQRQLERAIAMCRAETATMLVTAGELEGELAPLADQSVIWQSDVELLA